MMMKLFSVEEDKVRLTQGKTMIWEVKIPEIIVIAVSADIMNGDNETTIYSIFDIKGNAFHLDFIGLKGENYPIVDNFFEKKYNLRITEDFFGKTKIFYPELLRGVYPYNKSIFTWMIRGFHNAGGGILNKRVREYIKEQQE